MKKVLIIFGTLLVLFFVSLFVFFFIILNDKTYGDEYGVVQFENEQQSEDLYKVISVRAVNEHNPDVCFELPRRGVYYLENGGDHGWPGWGSFDMRERCFNEYLLAHKETDVCKAMEKDENNIIQHYLDKGTPTNYGYYLSSNCFKQLALERNDESLCDLAKETDAVSNCHAVLSKDVSYCYRYTKDEYDNSKYSRFVGGCFEDVVIATKNYETCLNIDSSDYGTEWWDQRNECLEIVAAFLKQEKKDYKFICDLMVVPEEFVGHVFLDEKSGCYEGELPMVYH